MLRLESENGWWLVTHPDHARLAGAFAEQWGNEQFLPPDPRAKVLKGIACHDDGWAARDANPQITGQGLPSAFSVELVGKYNLSLLACVNFSKPANLLHPLPLPGGGHAEIQVHPLGPRCFKLDPYPFAEPSKTFPFPARHIQGKRFSSPAELRERFSKATVKMLSVTVSAN